MPGWDPAGSWWHRPLLRWWSCCDRHPRLADRRPRLADRRPRLADRHPRLADRRPRLADRRPRLADRVLDWPTGVLDWPPGEGEPKHGRANSLQEAFYNSYIIMRKRLHRTCASNGINTSGMLELPPRLCTTEYGSHINIITLPQ